jgi:hypothetical protein
MGTFFTRNGVATTAVLAAMGVSSACRENAPPPAKVNLPDLALAQNKATSSIVATVNGIPIFAEDVARQAAAEGTPPTEALNTLISMETLVHAAIERHIPQSDDGVTGWKQILAQAWISRDLEPQISPDKIPLPVLKQVYEKAKEGFNHSRLVRIFVMDFYAFPSGGPQRRKQAQESAASLLTELQNLKPPITAEQLQTMAGTERWMKLDLKAGVTWQSETQPYPESIAKAALAMQNWGELSPVIEDASGFHVLVYLGERAGAKKGFDEAESDIRNAISKQWQKQRFSEITGELMTKAEVVVNAETIVEQSLK